MIDAVRGRGGLTWARRPHLSLVLACYNEAEHLEASFAEIRDTLEQARFPFEILFVDDVSRDRTREILARIVAAPPAARAAHDPARARTAAAAPR